MVNKGRLKFLAESNNLSYYGKRPKLGAGFLQP